MAVAPTRAAPSAAKCFATLLAACFGGARAFDLPADLPEGRDFEVPEPRFPFELRPVREAFPAFARGDAAAHEFDRKIGAELARVWEVVKDQRTLLNTHLACRQIFNFSGSPGEWLAEVQWHTPKLWHRWTRTEVRKYVELDGERKRLAYFLVGGLADWQPRLAFRETYSADAGNASETNLHVEVWYEYEEDFIGFPVTEELHNATRSRWEMWYNTSMGYADTVATILTGFMEPLQTGRGKLRTSEIAEKVLGYFKYEL